MKQTPNALRRTSNAERTGGAKGMAWRGLALLAGGVFVYAGAIKAADPLRFANDIANYHVLPWSLGVRLAFYLPWLELVCGAAVIVGILRRGALVILSALMVVFIAASVFAKARGIDVSCGCFGAASAKLDFAGHLALDVVILVALVALWIARREHSARTITDP